MQKLITILAVLAFSFSLAGCNEEKPTQKTQATGDGSTKRMYIAPREFPAPPPRTKKE